MVNPIKHYSIENHATVYDEESLTVLELCARLGAKLNELVGDHNKLDSNVKTALAKIGAEALALMKTTLDRYMTGGEFDAAIDEHNKEIMGTINGTYAALSARIDALSALEDGSTTGDAELTDARVSDMGSTYATLGANLRANLSAIKERLKSTTFQKIGVYGVLRNIMWNGSANAKIVSMQEAKVLPFPVDIRVSDGSPYWFGVYRWESEGDVTDNTNTGASGWVQEYTLPANTPFTITMTKTADGTAPSGNTLATGVDEFFHIAVYSPIGEYVRRNNALDNIIPTLTHASWRPAIHYYVLDDRTRLVTATPFKLDKSVIIKSGDADVSVCIHTWANIVGSDTPPVVTLAEDDENHADNARYVNGTDWAQEVTVPADVWVTLYINAESAGINGDATNPAAAVDVLTVEEVIVEATASTARDYNNPHVKAIAHRGYSHEAPENTLAAIRLAAEKGFKYVEFDVREDADGQLWLMHDATVDRTTNNTGTLTDMTTDEVAALDAGSWKSGKYAGEKVPTFEEAMRLCHALGIHAYVEIKGGQSDAAGIGDNVACRVAAYIIDNGYAEECSIVSFSTADMADILDSYDVWLLPRLGLIADTDESLMQTVTSWKTDYEYHNGFLFLSVARLLDILENDVQASEALRLNLCGNATNMEVWTTDDAGVITSLPDWVKGVCSNALHAGEVLYKSV